jgi:hypothetical protein
MSGRCREELTRDKNEEIVTNGNQKRRMGKREEETVLAGPYSQGANNL